MLAATVLTPTAALTAGRKVARFSQPGARAQAVAVRQMCAEEAMACKTACWFQAVGVVKAVAATTETAAQALRMGEREAARSAVRVAANRMGVVVVVAAVVVKVRAVPADAAEAALTTGVQVRRGSVSLGAVAPRVAVLQTVGVATEVAEAAAITAAVGAVVAEPRFTSVVQEEAAVADRPTSSPELRMSLCGAVGKPRAL